MKASFKKLDVMSWGGFMMFAVSSVITPICLPEISKTLATNFSESGGMETARTLLVVLVLLLAGVGARRWGKKPFITSGQYCLALGLFLISVSPDYPLLILSLMITGIGGGFTEALINPLVVDLHPVDSGKYLNITNAFYSIGVMAGALVFGELLTAGYSWRWIFRIAAFGALVVGIGFNGSRFPSAEAGDTRATNHVILQILIIPGFWLFAAAIFLGAGVESAFTFWSRTYVETYLKDVPRAGAIAVVVFAAMMAVGRLLAAKLSQRMDMTAIMLYSAILGVVVSGMIPFIHTLPIFYLLLAFTGLATACFWPSILAEAAGSLRVDATILFAMLASVGIAGFGFAPWIMGIIGDYTNLRKGFFILPGLFMLLIVLLATERRIMRTTR